VRVLGFVCLQKVQQRDLEIETGRVTPCIYTSIDTSTSIPVSLSLTVLLVSFPPHPTPTLAP
jgi:hypothetical protein